jgi:hypothetical protein
MNVYGVVALLNVHCGIEYIGHLRTSPDLLKLLILAKNGVIIEYAEPELSVEYLLESSEDNLDILQEALDLDRHSICGVSKSLVECHDGSHRIRLWNKPQLCYRIRKSLATLR